MAVTALFTHIPTSNIAWHDQPTVFRDSRNMKTNVPSPHATKIRIGLHFRQKQQRQQHHQKKKEKKAPANTNQTKNVWQNKGQPQKLICSSPRTCCPLNTEPQIHSRRIILQKYDKNVVGLSLSRPSLHHASPRARIPQRPNGAFCHYIYFERWIRYGMCAMSEFFTVSSPRHSAFLGPGARN